jgi:hypothetical protein
MSLEMNSAGVENVSADSFKGSPRILSERVTHVRLSKDYVKHG